MIIILNKSAKDTKHIEFDQNHYQKLVSVEQDYTPSLSSNFTETILNCATATPENNKEKNGQPDNAIFSTEILDGGNFSPKYSYIFVLSEKNNSIVEIKKSIIQEILSPLSEYSLNSMKLINETPGELATQ